MANFWAFLILGVIILSLGLVITIKRKASLLRRYQTVQPEKRAAYAFTMGIVFSGLGVFCIVMAALTQVKAVAEQTFTSAFLIGLGIFLVTFVVLQRRFINKYADPNHKPPRSRFLR